MARIDTFEEMLSWKKARVLARLIYKISNAGAFARDFGLRDQIRRHAVSILSNIAEGFERGGDREFHQFLSVAKGSCAELRAQLYVALDAEYITEKQFEELQSLSLEIGRLVSGMMGYLSGSPMNGRKFKAPSPSTELPNISRRPSGSVPPTRDFGL